MRGIEEETNEEQGPILRGCTRRKENGTWREKERQEEKKGYRRVRESCIQTKKRSNIGAP